MTKHSSTISTALTLPVMSSGSRSGLLAVVTCAGGASVGSISDELVEAVSTAASGLSETPISSGTVAVSGVAGDIGAGVAAAVSTALTGRLSVAVTCGA